MIKLIVGFRRDQEHSVSMEEAHKAYYLFLLMVLPLKAPKLRKLSLTGTGPWDGIPLIHSTVMIGMKCGTKALMEKFVTKSQSQKM